MTVEVGRLIIQDGQVVVDLQGISHNILPSRLIIMATLVNLDHHTIRDMTISMDSPRSAECRCPMKAHGTGPSKPTLPDKSVSTTGLIQRLAIQLFHNLRSINHISLASASLSTNNPNTKLPPHALASFVKAILSPQAL